MKNYTERQLEVINVNSGYNMVLAGPGCGKTDILAERVTRAYDKGDADLTDMLCLTFTNRAARGMYNRILQKLPEAASETAKVTAEELDEVADIVDNEIAPTSGSNVAASIPLMKEIGNFIKKMPRIVIDYGKNNADGKKIIGGGIKSIIKEFEKPIVTEIVNEIGV